MARYPGMTLLDLAGPQAALGGHGRTHLVWKTLDPVVTNSAIAMVPTTTFTDAPAKLDMLFVPGGFSINATMRDDAIVACLAKCDPEARFVTSVCSGSLLLGLAGLLDGYRAATYWALYDVLEALGVQPGCERVAVDSNRFTGRGVTARIDFGLLLLATLRGEHVAKITQLMMEYDPAPPFVTRLPRITGPELTAAALSVMGDVDKKAVGIAVMPRRHGPA